MMKRVCVLVLGICLVASTLASTTTPCLAAVAIFQQGRDGYQGVEDTSLNYRYYNNSYNDPHTLIYKCDENYGASNALSAGYARGGSSQDPFDYSSVGLIRFDVSSLIGQSIQSARLYVYLQLPTYFINDPGYIPWIAGVKPTAAVDADWVAGTSDGTIQPGTSCFGWKHYATEHWSSSITNWRVTSLPGDCTASVYTGAKQRIYDQYGGLSAVYQEAYIDLPPTLISGWANSAGVNGGLAIYGQENWTMSGGINNIVSSDSPYRHCARFSV
jgi:hypothetical protein